MKLTIAQAFSKTTPHPADERIRLTDNPDYLIALRSRDAAAVIWQREEDRAITQALKDMQGMEVFYAREDARDVYVDRFSPNTPLTGRATWKNAVSLPIVNDCIYLATAFDHAMHRKALIGHSSYLSNWTPPQPKESYAMHIDAVAHGSDIPFRILTSYTLNRKLTTEIYPGVYKPRAARKLSREFENCADMEALKKSLGRIRLEPRDALLLKGLYRGLKRPPRAARETLLHSRPFQPGRNLRLTYTLTRGSW